MACREDGAIPRIRLEAVDTLTKSQTKGAWGTERGAPDTQQPSNQAPVRAATGGPSKTCRQRAQGPGARLSDDASRTEDFKRLERFFQFRDEALFRDVQASALGLREQIH